MAAKPERIHGVLSCSPFLTTQWGNSNKGHCLIALIVAERSHTEHI